MQPEPVQHRRPRILSICVHAPQVPGAGGAVRAFHFANALADVGELTLVCLGGPEGDEAVDPRIAARCSQVITLADQLAAGSPNQLRSRWCNWKRTLSAMLLPWKNNWSDFTSYCVQYCPEGNQGRSASVLRFIFRNEFRFFSRVAKLPPTVVQQYDSSWQKVKTAISQIAAKEQFEIIFCENSIYYPFAEYARKLSPGASLVCNAANIEFKLHERLLTMAGSDWRREWQSSQARLIRNLERKAFRNSQLVITCSDEDRQLAEELAPNTTHVVIGNGVDIDYFQPANKAIANESTTILYTGSFRYPPNQDGLRYFLEEVYPLIQQQLPKVRFRFAGFDAKDLFDSLQINDPSIEYVSSPDDIRPCFDGAAVCVVPLRIGGGTRLKILEAMSMRIPIVSTTVGAEGIPCENGKHILLADQPPEFASAVVQLLSDQARRDNIAENAEEWVRDRFDWAMLRKLAGTHLESMFATTDRIDCE